ncbi:MAG TPA: alpha/beta hydrolase [Actinomycetota bacterium]|nr:alpha/beta hydrolase [Actinomycetota bacterium]
MPTADLGEFTLHFREHGSGDPPVLGIMGFGLDHRFWAAQIPAVTKGNRFIVFDNRGTGRSGRAPVSTINEMTKDALALLDYLEIDEAVIFGVSMGGAIAQRMAIEHADRVRALILTVTWNRPTQFMRRQNAVVRRMIELGAEKDVIELAILRMFTPRFFEWGAPLLDQMTRSLDARSAPQLPGADVLLAQLQAIEAHDSAEELAGISCPALVVGGRMDMVVPGFASEELAAAIPEARLEMLDSGHGLMVEEMERFNALVAGFLESL